MVDERLHIEELLKRFMEGESTLDEERELGDWFRSHEVDESLKPYQQMFAAFDAGLPYIPSAQTATTPPRRRIVWWQWTAAAVVAGLLALGGIRLAMRPTAPAQQPPIVAKDEPKAAVDTLKETPDVEPTLAKVEQATATPAAQNAPRSQKVPKTAIRAAQTSRQDSVEVTRTEGELELAESEYLAEQQELERQLQELRQQRMARQSGWHYTTLPCE